METKYLKIFFGKVDGRMDYNSIHVFPKNTSEAEMFFISQKERMHKLTKIYDPTIDLFSISYPTDNNEKKGSIPYIISMLIEAEEIYDDIIEGK